MRRKGSETVQPGRYGRKDRFLPPPGYVSTTKSLVALTQQAGWQGRHGRQAPFPDHKLPAISVGNWAAAGLLSGSASGACVRSVKVWLKLDEAELDREHIKARLHDARSASLGVSVNNLFTMNS